MLSSDRQTLVTNHEGILKRWLEHFSLLLNRPATASADSIESIAQNPILNSLSAPPTSEEVIKAVSTLQNGKAAGEDGIPVEIFKGPQTP